MVLPVDRGGEQFVADTIDRELRMIRGAIDLVASGGSPRVVLAGLHFGEKLLEDARRMAQAAGVAVVPLWTARSEGADLSIERIAP
jgi:hypothetical protein